VRHLDLFSGIGGFSIGLERAGFTTVGFCEIDPYCRAVLRKHWPAVPIHDDVRDLPYVGCDIITGGFPCQPWSHAGKQLGAEDDRHLWPAMLEAIKRERPAWVIGENVAGLVRMGLDPVLSDLEENGYAGRTFVIPACAVDAPHRRDRIWIVAHHNDGRRFQRACDGQPQEGMGEQSGRDAAGLRAPMAHAERQRGRGGDDQGENAMDADARSEDERGSYSRWRAEPGMGRVAYGVPGRAHRLRALGNAVVPQIPEIIGRAIMRAAESADDAHQS